MMALRLEGNPDKTWLLSTARLGIEGVRREREAEAAVKSVVTTAISRMGKRHY